MIVVPGAGVDQPTLRIEITASSIATNWDPVDNAARYQFRHRITGQRQQWQPPSTATSATITNPANNATYIIEARALISGSWRPWTTATITTG